MDQRSLQSFRRVLTALFYMMSVCKGLGWIRGPPSLSAVSNSTVLHVVYLIMAGVDQMSLQSFRRVLTALFYMMSVCKGLGWIRGPPSPSTGF